MNSLFKQIEGMRFLKKVVVFSITFIVLFTLFNMAMFYLFQVEMITQTEKVYDFFGTQLVMTCIIKIGDDVVRAVEAIMNGTSKTEEIVNPQEE